MGKRDGWAKYFSGTGVLDSEICWRNDKVVAVKHFYRSGKLKYQANIFNGKAFGLWKRYYETGQLSIVCYDDFYGDHYWVEKYDSTGNKYYDEGKVFSPQFIASPKGNDTAILDSIYVDNLIDIKIAAVQLQNIKTKIHIYLNNEKKELTVQNYTASFSYKFDKKGEFPFSVVGTIENKAGNILKHDSSSVLIRVD
jgi:hypothetical protein